MNKIVNCNYFWVVLVVVEPIASILFFMFVHLCYSTVTCKVLLNRPQHKIGQHCTIRCLILTRLDNRSRASLVLLYVIYLLSIAQSTHPWIRVKATHYNLGLYIVISLSSGDKNTSSHHWYAPGFNVSIYLSNLVSQTKFEGTPEFLARHPRYPRYFWAWICSWSNFYLVKSWQLWAMKKNTV